MITKVVLAKLSPTMEEGTIVKWIKQAGDVIKVGDVLAEIETDKANMEMEALGAGVLRRVLVGAGGRAPIGTLIGIIADAEEDISSLEEAAKSAALPPADAPVAPPPAAVSEPAPQPVPPPAALQTTEGGRVKASPLARSIAAQRGILLESVPGSGPGGRVIKRDLEDLGAAPVAFAATPAVKAAAARPAPGVTPGQELPLSNMRKTIARRLVESMFSAPHFYVTVEIDMERAVALRAQLAAAEVKISYNDLVVKACALALRRFPLVNASWGGNKLVTHAHVHVGVAVALPDGLLTPVVRDADRKSVGTIAAEIRELATRARDKRLEPDEYTGSTFTVSNLGMYDVTEFTAIINPPDSAILAVGAVRKQPVVVGDEIRPGQRMKVTLGSDHRVIDGALAAQFLAEVRRLLENPLLLFV